MSVSIFDPCDYEYHLDVCSESYSSIWLALHRSVSDLPTRLYLTGSTDEWAYFLKYGQRVSKKDGNRDVNKCKFVANKHSL